MALIRGKNWWWNYFSDNFFEIFQHVRGYIIVSNGYSETEIKLDDRIKCRKIYVAVAAEGIPVCGGNVDKVGAIQTDDHTFILYADIKSTIATVYWLVDIGDGTNDDQEPITDL